MRILLISRCPPYPLHLGDRLIVYHLAYELEARRHEIDLLAFANRPEDWRDLRHYEHYFQSVELFPEPRRAPLDYLRRALLPAARFPRRAEDSWSPEMWRAIEQRLAETAYDAIHLFGGVQVYEFFHALQGQPAVITPYESYSLYLRRELGTKRRGGSRTAPTTRFGRRIGSWLQWRLARAFESWMFTPYARVVVVSPPDRAELRAINPALNVEIIPNGVDLYEFRVRPTRREAAALLFLGNYEYAPNVDAALRLAREIFPAVQERVPDARLWLVGNAPPPELTALASESIHVTGRVPDVRPYLARAAVFVSPLRLGAGIKNKILEALALGCPVVATPLSVDGIDVRDGEDALVVGDADMSAAVLRLLDDAALQQKLAHNGRRLIESRYSWDHVAERYQDLYRGLRTED